MHSNAGVRSDLFHRPLDETLVTEFFGGVSQVELSDSLPSLSSKEAVEATASVAGGSVRRRRRKAEEGERMKEERGNERNLVVGGALALLQIGALVVGRARRKGAEVQ